jgi:hypothetical protein
MRGVAEIGEGSLEALNESPVGRSTSTRPHPVQETPAHEAGGLETGIVSIASRLA